MTRSILSTLFIFLGLSVFGQWDIKPPSIQEAKQKLLSDKEVIKQIEKEMGMPFEKLEFKHDGWSGYQKSGFSLTYRTCGESFYPAWPKDGCYTKFLVTGPKDADGVYKMMAVYADYSRSVIEIDECTLYNSWWYVGPRISSATEYGYKEFSEEEAKQLLLDYLRSGNATALDNFIEISDIDFKNYGQSSASSGLHYLGFYFKGTEAQFTDDRTSIIGMDDPYQLRMQIQIEKENGKWIATQLGLYTAQMYSYDQKYNPRKTELITKDYYASYKTDGFDAIYQKKQVKTKPNGELEKLEARVKELMNTMSSKGTELTKEDLSSFIAPSQLSSASTWFDDYANDNYRYVLKSFEYEGALPFKYVLNDQMVKIAFPEMEAQFDKYEKPKKKWKLMTSCRDCKRSSPSDADTNYHPMVWIWENGNWYLMDPQSAFFSREERLDVEQ